MRPTRRFLCSVAAAATVAACSRSPSGNFDRGASYFKEKEYAKAAACIETALQGGIPTAQAWNVLGVCRLNTGLTNEAITAFQESLKLDPVYSPARYNLAAAYLDSSLPDEAIPHLKLLTQAAQCPPSVYSLLGRAYMQAGSWSPARQTFDKLGDADTNPEVQNDLGIIETRLGNFKSAKTHFESAVHLDPTLAAVYLNLAILEHHYIGENQAAAQYYQKYVDLAPPSPQSDDIRQVLNTLSQEGPAHPKPPEAVVTPTPAKPLESPKQIVPQQVVAAPPPKAAPAPPAPITPPVAVVVPPPKPVIKRRTPIAISTLKAGNRAKAESYFNEGIKQQQQGKPNAAVTLYTKSITVDPTFAKPYYNMAFAYQTAHMADKALANYELAIAADPTFADAHFNYAIVLQDEGYLVDALIQYEKFLTLKPNDERGLFAVATLYSRDPATREKARQYYTAYLKIAPNSASSAQIREWLANNQ